MVPVRFSGLSLLAVANNVSAAGLATLLVFLSPTTLLAQTPNVSTPNPPGFIAGQPVSATGATTVASDPAVIDVAALGGSDVSAMINTVYTSTTLCPSSGNDVGCVIDARGVSGGQLVMKTNPFANRSIRVKLLLGSHTYVACVPWVVPQAGIIVEGSGVTGSTAQGTIIRAGTNQGDTCNADFPGGQGALAFSWQHGPFPVNNYFAVIEDGDGGQITDKFGSQWRFLTVDANNLADFCIFSASMEEKSGVFHFGCRNPKSACGFWDRAFQKGSPNGGGSGPTHFNIFDTTCDIPTNNSTYGWVYEGAPTSITLSGGTCSVAAHAYPNVSGGNVTSAQVTYGGSCTVAPACAINSASGTGRSCSAALSSGAVTITLSGTGTSYNNANRGGGPWIERSTIRGSDTNHRMADGVWIEGTYDAHISDIHCEWLGSNPNGSHANCVDFGGSGDAQNSGGRIENIDVGNNAGTGGDAQVVHLAAGGVSGASPSSQGTSLANIAFEAYPGSAAAIQDDTSAPLPVDTLCTGCLSLTNASGNGAVPQYISGWGTGRAALRSLTAQFTTTGTGLTDVPNWIWTIQTGKNYALHCQLSYQAATNGGLAPALSGTASFSNLWFGANVPLSASTFTNGIATGLNSKAVMMSVGTGGTNTNWMTTLAGQMTASASGTLKIQAASTGAGQLTINRGSWCDLKDSN